VFSRGSVWARPVSHLSASPTHDFRTAAVGFASRIVCLSDTRYKSLTVNVLASAAESRTQANRHF
jgi:hypothetical protein